MHLLESYGAGCDQVGGPPFLRLYRVVSEEYTRGVDAMTNALEQAINTDEPERAAKITQYAPQLIPMCKGALSQSHGTTAP